MNLFGRNANNPAHAIEQIAAITRRMKELTAQLASIEQKRDEAHHNVFAESAIDDAAIAALVEALEDQHQKLQVALAEVQRRRRDAERGLHEVETSVAPTKVSKNLSAIEVCAGEVRWHNGLLEQLWYVHYIGPTGAIEKTIEEWQPVLVSDEPARTGHVRFCQTA